MPTRPALVFGVVVPRWDLIKGGTPKQYGDFPSVAFLALSRDGKTLTAATNDRQDWRKRTFARWDVATGKETGRHALTTAGRWSGSLSPEDSLFAAPDADGKSIALVDPLTGREVRRLRECECPGPVSFSADGATMTTSSKDGAIRV
jgi:WD40 repeat protein